MGIEIKKARCVIIGSAPVDEAERRFIGTQVSPEDFLVCADGGYETARRLGLKPDLLIGDLDSCTEDFPPDIEAVRLPVHKDDTDMMYSLKECLGRGYRDFLLLGATGGRLDHTVANLQLLYHYNKYFSSLTMLDGMNRCFILDSEKDGAISIPREEGSYLSVFSLSERSHGVTIEGAKYEISDHTLSRDFPLGVSNEFKEKNTVISVNDGILLIVISKMD